MKKIIQFKVITTIIISILFTSCEDFLEIEAPDHKIVSKAVFKDDETAISAMQGIYNQLFNSSFSSGASDSVTVLAGLSSDVLTIIRTTNLTFMEFEQHEVQPNNPRNLNVWSSAYNTIYMTNALLGGLASSTNVSEEVKSRLEGEARFVRAFTYFYLVNLYGEVPLILNTDYRKNTLAARDSQAKVYQQIIADLEAAIVLLPNVYLLGERTQVNTFAAIALLARVNLYLENWEKAESLSSQLLDANTGYELLEDLDQVFLKNSSEAIWQLSPMGRGNILTNTNEGSVFIIHPFITGLSHLKLSEGFVESFMDEDKRLSFWIRFHQGVESYYPYKYKISNSNQEVSEYSMVLRLGEQYLIRAEAQAMQNDLAGAITDLDKIRIRAGLEPIAIVDPDITQEALIELILEERKKELFSEWGHRWLDLKRTGEINEVIGDTNPLWQESDSLYPIPEEERNKNPNLSQNQGY